MASEDSNGAFPEAVPPAGMEDGVAMILHSSGSTSVPKPIYLSHKSLAANASLTCFPDVFHTLPLFHHYGTICMWRCLASRSKVFLSLDNMSARHLIASIDGSTTVKWMVTVPFILKTLAEHDHGAEAMARFEKVIVSGSSCPKQIGDTLVARGIKLVALYGATEFGALATSDRDFESDKDWQHLRLDGNVLPYIHFEPVDAAASGKSSLHELWIRSDWPGLTVAGAPDGFYHSRDLFFAHPTVPNAYVYAGRLDDTLVHITGEKTNPVPMESIIRSSALVADCIVFGAGRAQCGVFIIPSTAAVESIGKQEDDAMRDRKLWEAMLPIVDAANMEAPSHSQIVPELVQLLPAGSRLPSGDKGSLMRNKSMALLADQVERVYRDFYDGLAPTRVQSSPSRRLKSSQEALETVRSVVSTLMGLTTASGADDTDLIALGVDSIMAARIRSKLQQSIQFPRPLSPNVVFDYPTLRKLAIHAYAIHQGAPGGEEQDERLVERSESEKMERLVAEFSEEISSWNEASSLPPGMQGDGGLLGQTILLTGATGSLGAHVLRQLSLRPEVERIVCLARATSVDEAKSRVEVSLASRKLPSIEELQDGREHANPLAIECLSSDPAKEHLGLDQSSYDSLVDNVEAVVHVAWPVNFNMSVDSFYPSIRGTVNLIKLASECGARGRQARFLFASSISAAMGRSPSRVEESISCNPSDSAPMGYARSKWIVERLCQAAGERVGEDVELNVVRIGQIIGDREAGIWNETEAIPLMLRTAKTLGCLPDLRGSKVSWLGVDVAGSAMAKLATRRGSRHGQAAVTGAKLVQLVNPCQTDYADILSALSKPENLGPTFDLVAPHEWAARLYRCADQDPDTNPVMKLKEHFRTRFGTSGKADDGVGGDERYEFETKGLMERLCSHADADDDDNGDDRGNEAFGFSSVTQDHVTRIVQAWRGSGFL